jgi:hypothetical protein
MDQNNLINNPILLSVQKPRLVVPKPVRVTYKQRKLAVCIISICNTFFSLSKKETKKMIDGCNKLRNSLGFFNNIRRKLI